MKYPVLVESLYDEELSNKVALRNLLEREAGYGSLDEVRSEGELKALREDLLAVFQARGLEVEATIPDAVAECRDPERLRRWHFAAITAESARQAVEL